MARVSIVIASSHSPFLYMPPEQWDHVRALRPVRGDVPRDSLEVNRAKHARCMKAFATLRQKIEAANPDLLLIFGDDQLEQFNFSNFPSLGMFLGEEFEGWNWSGSHIRDRSAECATRRKVKGKGHPGFGKELMTKLVAKGFDLAFSLRLPDQERGLGHAFMHPAYYLTPNYDIPILPFFVNCYYAPQPTGKRCFELGRAVRESIDESSVNLNVAIVGSGGLWHTPGLPGAYIDEEFDQAILEFVRCGTAWEMAKYFDGLPRPHPSALPEALERLSGGTGMSGGVGSGVGETRNWIVAASVAGGRGTVVDYVPVYASPCGMGFAFWDASG